jgi:hypothetical protein
MGCIWLWLQERGLEKPVGYNMPDVYDDEDNKGQVSGFESLVMWGGLIKKQQESWHNDGRTLELYNGANM